MEVNSSNVFFNASKVDIITSRHAELLWLVCHWTFVNILLMNRKVHHKGRGSLKRSSVLLSLIISWRLLLFPPSLSVASFFYIMWQSLIFYCRSFFYYLLKRLHFKKKRQKANKMKQSAVVNWNFFLFFQIDQHKIWWSLIRRYWNLQ